MLLKSKYCNWSKIENFFKTQKARDAEEIQQAVYKAIYSGYSKD